MNKKIISSILVGGLVLSLLSGCGGDKTANGEKEIIRVTFESPGEIDGTATTMEEAFAAFYEEYPNCEVIAEAGGSALMAKIAANDAPDIIRVNSALSNLPTFVNKGILMPLDDRLAKSELFDKDDIFPVCIQMYQYDGKEFGKGSIYGLPKDWTPDAMWMNTKMLKDAGYEVPTMENPMTYDDFMAYSSKVGKKNANGEVEVFSFNSTAGLYDLIESHLNKKGLSMWSEDFTKVRINEPEVRDVFKYYFELMKNGYMPSESHPIDGIGTNEIARGQLAANFGGLWMSGSIASDPDKTVGLEDIELCPTLMPEANKPAISYTTATGGVITKSTKNPDLAYACWEYIFLGDNVAKRASTGLNLPIKKSVAEALAVEDEFIMKNFKNAVNYAENGCEIIRVNPYVAYTGLTSTFKKYFWPAVYGEYTFDEAMKTIENEIQILVDEGIANS